MVLQVGLGSAHVGNLGLLLIQHRRMLRLRRRLRVLQILQPALQLLRLHVLLEDLALLVEVVEGLEGLVVRGGLLLALRCRVGVGVLLFRLTGGAVVVRVAVDRVVDEGMQLLLGHGILRLRLRYHLLLLAASLALPEHQALTALPVAAILAADVVQV